MVSAMKHRALALMAVVAMACALTLGFTAQAFASSEVPEYNSYCKISAVAANTQAGSLPTTSGSSVEDAAEDGQYIDVTLTFPNGVPNVTAAQAESYLQDNVLIANRYINGNTSSEYVRDVYDVSVNSGTITFKIGPNTGGTTANYKGTLRIECGSSGGLFYSAMNGAKAETLIQTGVALSCTASSSSAVVSVTSGALNRGMVHVLFSDNGTTLFTGSSTFQSGIITIHAHSFATMTTSNYASAIATAANTAASESGTSYRFVAVGSSIYVTNGGADCAEINASVYDGAYLNAADSGNGLPVGDIDEQEYTND